MSATDPIETLRAFLEAGPQCKVRRLTVRLSPAPHMASVTAAYRGE